MSLLMPDLANITEIVDGKNDGDTEYNLTNSIGETHSSPNFNFTVVNIYALVQIFVIILNLGIINIVFHVPTEKRSPGTYLAAHFSYINVLWSLADFLSWLRSSTLFGYNIPASCQIMSLCKNFAYAAYPLAFVSLICERRELLLGQGSRFLWKRAILLTWIVAGLESFPTLFTSEYETNASTGIGECIKIPIFGSAVASTLFYLLRFLLLHNATVGFLLYALHEIRSQRNYFMRFPIVHTDIRRSARKLGLLYWYCLLFICNWIGVGYAFVAYSLLGRTQNNKHMNNYIMAILLWELFYIFINPVLFLSFNKDIVRRKLCCKPWYKRETYHQHQFPREV